MKDALAAAREVHNRLAVLAIVEIDGETLSKNTEESEHSEPKIDNTADQRNH